MVGGSKKSSARCGRIEKIAFEIKDLNLLDGFAVEIVLVEFSCRAEMGVHGALAVGGDEDEAASRRIYVAAKTGIEAHANRTNVVGEDICELVFAELPHETRAAAERSDAGTCISRGTARGFYRRPHPFIERGRLLG